MYCIYCGSDNPDDALFCRSCGKRQVLLEDQPEPSSGRVSNPTPSTAPDSSWQITAGTTAIKQEGITASSTDSPSTLSNGLRFSQSNSLSVPTTSPSISGSSIGVIIAGLGGVVALLAFFFMPYVSYSYFSFTGQQLASFGSQANNGSGQLSDQLSQLQLLWLEPLVAGVVVILAGYLLYKNLMNTTLSSGRGGAISLSVIGGLSFLILLIVFAANSQSTQSAYGYSQPALASFISSGFWVYALAMLASAIGGAISAAQIKSSL